MALASAADPVHGELLAGLAGCASCHSPDPEAPLAGGYALQTRFGTFYASNITPDPTHGIGGWTYEDFERAMREGRDPDGRPYYPAFPYTSYTRMSDADLADLWAWLSRQAPVSRENRPHEVRRRYRGRTLLGLWRLVAFREGGERPPRGADAEVVRGAYLVRGPGHCGECHTPRSGIGRASRRRELAGSSDPPEPAPNLTPHHDGLGGWSSDDILTFLDIGMTPEGDVVGGVMGRLVRDGTSKLPRSDRVAIAAYLQSLRPVAHRKRKRRNR